MQRVRRKAGEKGQVRFGASHSFEGFCAVCCKTSLCFFPLPHVPSPNLQRKEAGTQERRGHEKVRLSGKHKDPTEGPEAPWAAELKFVVVSEPTLPGVSRGRRPLRASGLLHG